MNALLSKKFGGTITLGCDPLLPCPRSLPSDALFFSHGRAAMIWIMHNVGKFQSAVVCAYTWPEIPRMMKRYNCEVGFFDFTQKDIVNLVKSLPGRCFVVIPVFYGFQPWIDYQSLARTVGDKAFVLLDAAQTTFGFEDYSPPAGGAVLSCPHKATAINDGAVLVLDRITEQQLVDQRNLDPADQFCSIKKQSRLLLASNNKQKEREGLRMVKKLEETWISDPPQRMTDKSLKELALLDSDSHAAIRQKNYCHLKKRLYPYLPPINNQFKRGVPFALAVSTKIRKELLTKLYSKRVFATSLWYNAIHDEKDHPIASQCTKELMALPIDQRYSLDDMDQLADIVLSCL